MSLRKSCSESVEISRASTSGSSFSGSSVDAHDVDLHLFERAIEIVDLAGVEVELVECERDLVLGHRPRSLRRLEQGARFHRVEYVGYRRSPSFAPCAHVLPLLL